MTAATTAGMTTTTLAALVLLGLFHGLNPAMGWLFALALGLQERRRTAVLRALPPIALGHAASVAGVVLAVTAAGAVVPAGALRVVGAVALVGVGAAKLLGASAHPRWVGMRVTGRDLTLWSFLVSSAHGAGLMLLPALLAHPGADARMAGPHAAHAATMATASGAGAPAGAVLLLHTAAMFVAMGTAALAAYQLSQFAGLDVLRRAWVNLDALWAGALVAAGVATFAIA